MTIPLEVFSAVIILALVLVVVAPFVLIGLLFRDWRRKRLW
jgi:hypothetical protein